MSTHPVLTTYAEDTHRADPLAPAARALGRWDGRLPRPGTDEDRARALRAHLAAFGQIEPRDATTRLDLEVSRIDATHRLRELEELAPWTRIPYRATETLGAALQHAISGAGAGEGADAGELLHTALSEVPRFLGEAVAALDPARVPEPYAEAALAALPGLGGLLDEAERVGADRAVVTGARSALTTYEERLCGVAAAATGSWVAGRDYLEHRLRDYFRLDVGVDELAEWGREQVARDQQRLVQHAAACGEGTWQEQIETIRADHPAAEDLLDTYRAAVARSRQHTLDRGLASVPDGEECLVDEVAEFQRHTMPMGFMDLAPTTGEALRSYLRITPVRRLEDGRPDPDHLAESCHALITTIAGHETYPGHHLQRMHHKLATAGNTSIRRTFTSAVFVEGWGLYVEDVMRETGFMDSPGLTLYALRNSLWRSARVVVDVGLHTGTLSREEAVEVLMEDAALGRHIAEGEVRRYIRHDNPSYPSAYALGRQAFHDLRSRWETTVAGAAPLGSFHDAVMGYGSIPHALFADDLLAGAAAGGTR